MLFSLYSCYTPRVAVPTDEPEPQIAVNAMNTISLRDLNLKTGDYTVLPAIPATASVTYEYIPTKYGAFNRIMSVAHYIIATDENEDASDAFAITYGRNCVVVQNQVSLLPGWRLLGVKGNLKAGYLGSETTLNIPERAIDAARNLALYRLISQAQAAGADGLTQPIVSVNMAVIGNKYYYRATATASPIVLKKN